MDFIVKMSIKNLKTHFFLAIFVRCFLIALAEVLDTSCEVKYSDIDYQIFTDAGKYVSEGLSPYKRPTYRYTPLLAWMMVPNITVWMSFGKFLFCIFDLLTAWLVYEIQKNQNYSSSMSRLCACLWLYNPLPIVISTRGSAEAIMTFLVMLSIYCFQKKKLFISGLVYGLSVHVKIYPCIYALTFYFSLSKNHTFSSLLLPSRNKISFILASVLGFGFPTVVSIALHKDEYLEHAFWYHLVRKDIRHNFSPYFYAMYLTSGTVVSSLLSVLSFMLQTLLIMLVSWKLSVPQLLPSAMLVETFIFVTYNKVCTSQYFLWYLCLFPLSYPLLPGTRQCLLAFGIWLLGQGLWLLPAYLLEFRGQNRFLLLSFSSLAFFSINVLLICMFLRHICLKANLLLKEKKIK